MENIEQKTETFGYMTKYAAPLGRVMLAAIFVMAGVNKIGGYAGTQAYMEAFGLPGVLLPLVIAFEILAGLALAVGYKTRITAFLLAGFSVVSAIIFHANFADQIQSILFMKNIAIAGGMLMIVAHGGGVLAIDKE